MQVSHQTHEDGRFQDAELIGGGASERVYRAYDSRLRRTVVIRQITISATFSIPPRLLCEISALKNLSHPNVVALFEVNHSRNPAAINMILEWLPRDLCRYLQTHQQLSHSLAAQILSGVLAGLSYCHSHRVVLQNVKPDNILLDSNCIPRLSNFDRTLATQLRDSSISEKAQHLRYCAPELLLGSCDFSWPIDIWSAGCVFFEMVSGRPPFSRPSQFAQLQELCRVRGSPNDTSLSDNTDLMNYSLVAEQALCPEDLREFEDRLGTAGAELLKLMLQPHPQERITASAALAHPFFSRLAN